MLNIFTSIDRAEKAGYEVKNEIDTMFHLRAEDNMKNQYTDHLSTLVLKQIEGMKSRVLNRIDGKFGEVSLYDISTGGKGCILAINYNDFIIDAAQLGKNCLQLLLDIAQKDININIVYQEPLYIFDGYNVSINNELYTGYEASKAMEDAIYEDMYADGGYEDDEFI